MASTGNKLPVSLQTPRPRFGVSSAVGKRNPVGLNKPEGLRGQSNFVLSKLRRL